LILWHLDLPDFENLADSGYSRSACPDSY